MRFPILRSTAVVTLILATCFHSQAQDISRMEPVVTWDSDTLEMAFAGGLEAPQLSSADLNLDGTADLFIFDRVGDVIIPMTYDGPDGSVNYSINWALVDQFPNVLSQWVVLADFNKDGLIDIFGSTQHPGIQGVDVYRGRNNDGKLGFERMTFDHGSFDLLYVEVGGNYTPLYSSWIDVPAIVDVDGDGDLDILTFEPGGIYVPYHKNLALEQGLGIDTFEFDIADICWGKFKENEFSEEVILSTDPSKCAGQEDPPIQLRHSGSTLAAYDHDRDGDMELLVGDLAAAQIVYLHNGGTADKAFMTDQLAMFPAGTVPVDLPYFVSPFILDLDHDGREDFIAAANSESFTENYDVLWYYEDEASSGEPEFSFRQSDLFVSEMLDFGSESRPAVLDVDGDGLFDIVIGTGGYYDEGLRDPRLIFLKNVGTADAPEFEVADDDFLGFSEFGVLPTSAFAPEAGDLDGDGDDDLVVGELDGQLFFVENTGGEGNPPVYADPVYPYMDIYVGGYSTPAIVDINGDGLMDLVVGERIGNNDNTGRCSNMNYFENQGDPGSPFFNGNPTVSPNTQCLGRVLFDSISAVAEFSSPEYFRSGGELRMITGSDDGALRVFADVFNNTTEAYDKIYNKYGGIREGFRTVPEMFDIDQDGYYEMVVGNKRGGVAMYNTDFKVDATSIANPGPENDAFRLWPNPASDVVHIGGSDRSAVYDIELFDAIGRLVLTRENVSTFRVFNLDPGVYFAKISAGASTGTVPFVVSPD